MDGLFACDFFTVDTPTTTWYCLFVIKVASREAKLVNITTNPTGNWMAIQGRELTNPIDGFLKGCTHLIHDREPAFVYRLDQVLKQVGIKPVVTPPRSPNLNAFAERFVRSVREDCLDHTPIFGEGHLRRVLQQYFHWHNHERPRQGLGGAYIDKLEPPADGPVAMRARLSGLLPHFYCTAA